MFLVLDTNLWYLLSDFDLKKLPIERHLTKVGTYSFFDFVIVLHLCDYSLSSKYVSTFPLIHKKFRYE